MSPTIQTPDNPNVYPIPGQRVSPETAADALFVPENSQELLLQPDQPAKQYDYAHSMFDEPDAMPRVERPVSAAEAQHVAEALALNAAPEIVRTPEDDYRDVAINGSAAVMVREDHIRHMAAQYNRSELELAA